MPKADLRDYLAAERTLLAWIRTGLALMGFGFVVARFGLFLQQLRVFEHASSAAPYGFSLWFGTALIAVGVLVNAGSAWHHIKLVRQLDRGESGRSHSLFPTVATALFLALVGLAMAIYLVSVRRSATIESNLSEDNVMAASENTGIVNKSGAHTVDQTVDKLKNILQTNGVTLIALVDHSGEAEKVGMKMRPTKLPIFGRPKAGTPLMLAAPSIVIDLTLKMLVWEDSNGKVWLSYNSPAYLAERHGLPEEFLKNVTVVEVLATAAGQ